MDELAVLRQVDFDWVVRSESVWNDLTYDVVEIHAEERKRFRLEMDAMGQTDDSRTPLGRLVLGPGGSGKTHLLRYLRQEAAKRNMTFLFADMTGVRDFWETMRLQIIESLDHETGGGYRVCSRVLAEILNRCSKKPARNPLKITEMIADIASDRVVKFTDMLIRSLAKRYRLETRRYQDVIRALVLFNSDDPEQSNVGWAWFLGTEIDRESVRRFRFATSELPAVEIVRALSWLLSVRGPTLLAIDQVDNIVAQYTHLKEIRDNIEESPRAAEQRRRVLSITEEMAAGFSDLIQNVMRRTLVVLSCHRKTWDYMFESVLKSSTDRFGTAMELAPMRSDDAAKRLIEQRLAEAYADTGFRPRYATWPFQPTVFDGSSGLSPREILQKCNAHREMCLRRGQVMELESFEGTARLVATVPEEKDEFEVLDEEFEVLKSISPPLDYLDPHQEDACWSRLLQCVLRCLLHENPPEENVDTIIDTEFAGKRKNLCLHGRLRLIEHARQGLERHYCFRAIFQANPVAFQSRLKAAITASGIDRNLFFRQLVIIRNTPIPSGPKTEQLVECHHKTGGLIVSISDDDLSVLRAIESLASVHPPRFEEWLRTRRPISSTRFAAESQILDLQTDRKEAIVEPTTAQNAAEKPRAAQATQPAQATRPVKATKAAEPDKPTKPVEQVKQAKTGSSANAAATSLAEPKFGTLFLGRRDLSERPGEPVCVPWTDLARHALILGGSGSGKTVLIKRIVEEAALAGIPSIVVDKQYDLSRLGDRPPDDAVPSSWTAEDHAAAKRYREQAEVIVWTPGLEGGNPLNLSPLPDFEAVVDDPDQTEMAVQLAADSLHDAVNATGNSDKSIKKRAILAASMRYFAEQGGGSLDEYIQLLRDPPLKAVADLSGCDKIAGELADLLVARKQRNPLWRSEAESVEPETLFGLGNKRTRISVLNLFGLGSETSKQEFINQISMRLYTWIKKHPAPAGKLRGLLVIDEAKDFVPAGKGSACKETLCRMTAQARKFGLGLIFATQAPKDIDHHIVNNCFSQFYGQFNSPTAISTVKELLAQKRVANPSDISRLRHGRFYFFNTNVTDRAFKIFTPMCLSHHASLDEPGVLERARRSKTRVASAQVAASS